MNHQDLEVLQEVGIEKPGVNLTADVAIVPRNFSAVIQSVMSQAQWEILAGRTPKHLIKKRPGKGGKTFSYVPHGYVTAKLNQAFGFDWDWEIIPQANGDMFKYLEAETGTDYKGEEYELRPASVIVHGRLTVRVRDPDNLKQIIAEITKSSTGEKEVIKGMTWGGLIKSAESDAFKKAASRLGIALDLYWQDMDEDYLYNFVGEVNERRVEMRGFVDAAVTEGKDKDEIAKALQDEYEAGFPEIARLLEVEIGEVISWLK